MTKIQRRSVIAMPFVMAFGQRVAAAQRDLLQHETSATLPQPTTIASKLGVLQARLVAHPAKVDMGAGTLVSTYTYNGIVPGETWITRPGDTMLVHLQNDLPPAPPAAHHDNMTRPHMWTNTNLHTHGLHVSPVGNSDNVFLNIPPGESFDYEIRIPDDHTGGHFWYHPHLHGGVAHQVRAGMAGSLIVRGEIDEVPEVAMAREQLMVLQAIELSKEFELMDPIPFPTGEESFYPRQQILYPINGVMNPEIRMYPGEVQRWRLLNAAEGKFMSLRLESHDLHAIAWDGLTMSEPEAYKDLMMAPSNRAEVLVKAGAPGVYKLILTPGSSQHPGIPGMPHMEPDPANQDSNELKPQPMMTLIVEGDGPEMDLPTSLPAYDPPIREIARRREVHYTVERADIVRFVSFGIDGDSFDPTKAPYQMVLGTTEEWEVLNDIDEKLPHHAHGLHIHVNPFRVTHVNGEELARPIWRDTFALSGQDNDSFVMQMNIDDFTGKFVQHCHVLTHEDLGMMEALEVVEP